MTLDRAAIDAVTNALRDGMPAEGWDLDGIAAVAVTTLQGLGWTPPRRRPDTNATEAWDAYERAMSREETEA